MIDIIKTIVVLLSLAVVIVPAFLIKTLNVKKNVRYKQFCYPCAALLFSIVACIVFTLLGKLADFIINLDFFQKFLNWLSPKGKLDYVVLVYTAIIVNALLMLAFFMVKSVLKIVIKKTTLPSEYDELKGIEKIYWRVISFFYDIESDKGNPLRKWVKIQFTLKYASWILSALYILLMIFLQFPVFMSYSWIPYKFMQSSLKTLYLWPVISFILINEFRWFIEGKEEFSKTGKMIFEHSEIHNVSDYRELAEQYKLQFPERFGGYIEGSAKGAVSNYFNDCKYEGALEEAIAVQLKDRGYTVNTNFLSCIRHLANGEDALIDASVFSDFGEYLFIYLNTLLARGENVLFLCADDESADNYGEYISDKFKSVNNFHKVWIIKGNTEIHGSSDADILVVTPQLALDDNAFIGQDMFFGRLSTVIMINTAEVIAKDGAILALLAHKLNNMVHKNSQTRTLRYICLSENVPPETSNTLKQILNLQKDLYICDGYQSFDNTHLMLWNYESGRSENEDSYIPVDDGKSTLAQDNLFGDSASQTYWGVSLPIACVGMKYSVSKIAVISHNGTPYRQIVNSMKNQVNRMSDYFNSEIGFGDFDNRILLNRVDNEDTHKSFIIVEDDLNNIPLAIYNYSRFGGTDTTMIHIISKPYMLRDYFTANAEKYISKEAEINMIMPSMTDTKQIIVTKLLCEASEGGIEENDLINRMKLIDSSVSDIEQALEACRDIVFDEHNNMPVEYYFSFNVENVFNRDIVDYEKKNIIRLKIETPLAHLIDSSKQGKMELRGRLFGIGVFADHLHQNFMPTQSFVHRGNLYTVDSVDSATGIVHVREASDRLNSPVDYVQVRNYTLKGQPEIVELLPVPYDLSEKRLTSGYEVALYNHAHITVDTLGYYALNSANGKLDLVNGPSYKPLSDNDRKNAYREYSDANIVSFKIKDVGSDESDKVAFLLAVMMQEMMKTIFPYSHNCIAVCPVLARKEEIYDDALGGKIKNAYPQVEVAEFYEHNSDDAEILIFEDSISEVGMIKTLLRNEQYPFAVFFDTVLAYLTWYDTYENTGNISKNYLYFGADEAPSCFDFDTLMTICSEFETIKRRGPIKVDRITSKGQCSYCHKDLFNVEYTEIKDKSGINNRKLCSKCAAQLVTDENELKNLYKQVRSYLCETFGIELSDDINVRFTTAEKIRKKMKTDEKRTVLGFSNSKTREIWIEADAPRANILDVLVHELTHMWQFDNIKTSDSVYTEGHASYVEVQYMLHDNRKEFAKWQEDYLTQSNDDYGKGFCLIRDALNARSDYNSFTYMLEMFADADHKKKHHGKGGTAVGEGESDTDDDIDEITDDDNEDTETGERNRTPGSHIRYAYNLLSEEEKRIYNVIMKAISLFQSEVNLPSNNLKSEDIYKILRYINRDCPELFWFGINTVMSEANTNMPVSVKFDYCMTKATAISRQKKIDESLKPFFESVNDKMSDYEVVQKIYENIINLVDYDSVGLEESKNETFGNKPDDLRSIYGVFVNRKVVCAGYAVATQYLLNRMGLECTYIRGNVQPDGYHAWNLLKLEGDYYYMDTTWGDWSNTDKTRSREGIGYDYFCITTKELLKDHTPDSDFPVPECTATKCNYYVRNGLLFNEYSLDSVKKAAAKLISKDKYCVSLKFTTEEAYEAAVKALFKEGGIHEVIKYINSGKNKVNTSCPYSDNKDKLKINLHFSKI